MSQPLNVRDWIEAVDELGHIMTVEDFVALPLGHPTPIVALEYAAFRLALSYGMAHVAVGKDYTPKAMFGPCAVTFVRTSGAFSKVESYSTAASLANVGPVIRVRGRFIYSDGMAHVGTVYSARDDHHASTGSGDGWTRYVPIAALDDEKLPPICWDP